MASRIARTAVQFAVLMAFWFALSGKLEVKYISLGAIGIALVLWKGGDLLRTRYAGGYARPGDLSDAAVHWVRFLGYLPWLIWSILVANLQVAYLILHPKLPIDPVLVRFRTDLRTDVAQVLLAHSITLTPGTVSIDVQNGHYLVHAITPDSASDLIDGRMQNRVRRVFGLPLRPAGAASMSRQVQRTPR